VRYRQLPLEQINVTDRNIRKTTSEEGMAELTASIARFGLLQPIVVFETGEDQFDLVTGHRRFAAVCELGWDSIPAMVTKSEEQAGVLAQAQENLVREGISLRDELDLIATAIQLVENTQREKLSDIDGAEALLRLAGGRNGVGRPGNVNTTNISVRDLAAIIGKSHVWVSRRLSLLDLPEDVLDRVQHHDPGPSEKTGVGFSSAQEIARLNGDPEVQRKLADKVEKEGMTARQTASAVKKIKEDPTAAEAVLAAKVDDSSFDAVTTRKADKTPAKLTPPPPSNAPDEVMRYFSQGYQKLLQAFDEDRRTEVEADGRFGEVCADIAYNACYLRTLLDNVIYDWALEKKCSWTQEKAAEVAVMGSGPRVIGLELIGEEAAANGN